MDMIEVGDWVDILDDTISGIVKRVIQEEVEIETEDGFELTIPIDKVIKSGKLRVEEMELKKAKEREYKEIRTRTRQRKSTKKAQDKVLEVDLHAHELLDSSRGMSNFEILNLQLNAARQQLEWAMENHFRKVIFIHGIGKGVLRMELETLLRRYDEVEFYDAEWQKYGRGATEVLIHPNS